MLILHIYSTLYYTHFNCPTRTTKLSNREYTLDLDILSHKRYMTKDFFKFLTLTHSSFKIYCLLIDILKFIIIIILNYVPLVWCHKHWDGNVLITRSPRLYSASNSFFPSEWMNPPDGKSILYVLQYILLYSISYPVLGSYLKGIRTVHMNSHIHASNLIQGLLYPSSVLQGIRYIHTRKVNRLKD
jgi:hypothetical protein